MKRVLLSVVLLACIFSSLPPGSNAQSVQTSGLQDQQMTHLPIAGTNVSQWISHEFLGDPSGHRLQSGFVTGIDSLRVKGSSYSFSISNRLQRGSSSALAKVFPQSLISVIDTAIVRSTIDTTRHVYSFNSKAKMTSDVTQRLKGEVWVDTLRQTNTYDANRNILSSLYETWTNDQWVSDLRGTSTYDANGRVTSSLSEYWTNGQWVNNRRGTSTYDANGNMLSLLNEQWSNGQWVGSFRYTITYDANGRGTSFLDEQWSNDRWVNGSRTTVTYDANGRETSFLAENWSNGQWVNNRRGTSTYDANRNTLSSLYEQWSNGQWVNSQRITFSYDANGSESSNLVEFWYNGQWVNDSRGTFTYDANGRETSYLSENWSTGQWVNSFRNIKTYDAQENLTSVLFNSWLNSSWIPAAWNLSEVGGYFVVDSAANEYELGIGYSFSFIRRLMVTGVASQGGNVPAVYSLSQNYPNPFNPSTVVSYQLPAASNVRLVVYDLIGREVSVLVNEHKEAGSYTAQFNAGGLASGVYFYRLQAGSFVETKNLLLLR